MSDAKSYEGRYHMPGWIYVVRSKSMIVGDKRRVYKVGGTTVGPDERLYTLNYAGRYGISDWEFVSCDEHSQPFHVETKALRNLRHLKIDLLNGHYCGNEMLASTTEEAVLEGVVEAIKHFELVAKLAAKRTARSANAN